jgi:hypothetical protein
MASPWTPAVTSASGQVFEFRLWATLTEQSRGQLHIFLPLTDRGVDNLVHRVSDGAYLQVQAKGRSELIDGEVHLVVWADSIAHDDVVIVSGLVVDGGLGPTMLAVPAAEFKRLANLTSNDGRPIYSMEYGMRPRSDSRWLPWLKPVARLAESFGVPYAEIEETVSFGPPPERRSDLGYLGEVEVLRRLAVNGNLNLFRAFPDWETVEIPVLHLESRKVVGLQVKTVGLTRDRPRATVDVHASSFRAAPTTYFVVLGWLRDEGRFGDDCLLIPSAEIEKIGRNDGDGHIAFEFHATSEGGGAVVDEYRQPLNALESSIAELLLQGTPKLSD